MRSETTRPMDLAAQLESLLHTVWQCEAEWRLDDRIDLALRRDAAARRAAARVSARSADRRRP